MQESAVEGDQAAVRIAGVCTRRELTVPIVVMYFVSDFTECIPIPTLKQD